MSCFLILIKNGYLPVIIKQGKREDYYRALMKADEGKLDDLIQLVGREEINALQTIIEVLKKSV
jgi:Fic family protein